MRGQRVPTPKRCQWRIIDRNDLDAEYDVYFAPDMQTMAGNGDGFQDKHFGSTEPKSVTFTGIRQ